MRVFFMGLAFAAALALPAAAQSSSQATVIDINGNRAPAGPEVTTTPAPNGYETTERARSMNGRMSPLERVEQKTLRDDAAGKLVERVVRRYDGAGNLASTEKLLIDERKEPNGNSIVETTTYASGINGDMRLVERSSTRNELSGTTQTSDTVIERATINGGFDVVEKKNAVIAKRGDGQEEAVITYRKDPGGSFYAAVRSVTDRTVSGNTTTDNTAKYEVGATGRLELHAQTVKTVQKRPGGGEDVAVDLFDKNIPGVVNDTGALRLKEHEIIARRPAADGAVVETFSVQSPSLSDPNKLGPPRQLSETVCKGKCGDTP